MISTQEIQDMLGGGGGTLVGEGGDKLGKVSQVFLDDETGRPEWATIAAGGLFGGKESFVPLGESTLSGNEITVPYDKAKVKDAPQVTPDSEGHISKDQEAELYEYYGMKYSTAASDSGLPAAGRDQNRGGKQQVGRDTSGPTTDEAMTRSEEQLKVGTEKVETGKARLRKFVVTENVTTTVPVSHEEVRLVSEPITDENRGDAMAGGDITSEEHEVTLYAERPVVEKEVVPVERVRMDTETVTGEQKVTEEVRKEKIESDPSDVQVPGKPAADQDAPKR
ncbi:MAG: PRC and DUF2382 domain-containing protein [Actinomycetota bacterium]|nr:PRC and DUF2382 domain-containing protein [Actinomycetota bacterium]